MYPTRPLGISSDLLYQSPTIEQKLSWTRNYPINHLSMGIIHFADTWFGLKTASSSIISDEVKYQLFFAAHAYRKTDGKINFGENSGACFYIRGLKVHDVVQLYRILHAYHQHEKSQKGPHDAIFGHHLLLIEMHLKKLCSSDIHQGQEVIQAFLNQDKYHQQLDIRERLVAVIRGETPANPERITVVPKAVVQPAFDQIPDNLRISPEKIARHVHWKDRIVLIDEGEIKMEKNALKAIREHIRDNGRAPYISIQEIETVNGLPDPTSMLELIYSEFETIGSRDNMEDTHFYQEFDKAALMAVFDGHGGARIAKIAQGRFEPIFLQQFQESIEREECVNMHSIFEKTIIKLQEEIATSIHGYSQGCTATIVFIDKENHIAYTANLGDSEARLYMAINGEDKIIPLSCVRDWSSKFDATRISIIQNDPNLVKRMVNIANPKDIRYKGLNVSRALGDLKHKGTDEKPAVIQKPKISMQRIPDPAVYGKSVLVMGCDGLWDFSAGSYNEHNQFVKYPEREAELAKMIATHANPMTLAKEIGDTAFRQWESEDNITVMTLTIN